MNIQIKYSDGKLLGIILKYLFQIKYIFLREFLHKNRVNIPV